MSNDGLFPEPNWLTSQEMAAWRPLITVAMRLPAALDTQLRSAGMTHFEFAVLATLSEAPGRGMGLSRLAREVNASPSRLSHVLRRLRDRGWLERVSGGRSARAVLTDPGFDALSAAARGHVDEVRRLVYDALDERDVADLARIMPKLAAGLVPGAEPDSDVGEET
ncbi:MarR family transcriptional regulator [Tsukamurella sp. 8F]|uniref:MarR family winged helix-turn-helix transcriptional regulator n=1 Tax=unclassified Tsukamurella TaxID=2633480 RepID=UPI0023B9BE28|nr:MULTISPECIES: MarR family transcriptional regulator [unclassified Tsukamurella]MDF0532478.1 MarR family transcriptional regulator [Tsukamurella sp. 8J]MDF0589321.1 MarR family transcriptional regulator [Tsukamurella sp. 8F]